MLTTLPALHTRLSIPLVDTTHDDLLTQFLLAAGAHFDRKCNRIFGYAETTEEFPADQTELLPARYPLILVDGFQIKSSEGEDWVTVENVEFLVRNRCVISFPQPLGTWRQQLKVFFLADITFPTIPATPLTPPSPTTSSRQPSSKSPPGSSTATTPASSATGPTAASTRCSANSPSSLASRPF